MHQQQKGFYGSNFKVKNLKDLNCRRQYSVDRYYVDFYCASLRLAIELDGENHLDHYQQKKDKDRQEAIENLGIKGVVK